MNQTQHGTIVKLGQRGDPFLPARPDESGAPQAFYDLKV
jgi:hypothetical protein